MREKKRIFPALALGLAMLLGGCGAGEPAMQVVETVSQPAAEPAGGAAEKDAAAAQETGKEEAADETADITAGKTSAEKTGNTASGETGSKSSGETGSKSSGKTGNKASGETGSKTSGKAGNKASEKTAEKDADQKSAQESSLPEDPALSLPAPKADLRDYMDEAPEFFDGTLCVDLAKVLGFTQEDMGENRISGEIRMGNHYITVGKTADTSGYYVNLSGGYTDLAVYDVRLGMKAETAGILLTKEGFVKNDMTYENGDLSIALERKAGLVSGIICTRTLFDVPENSLTEIAGTVSGDGTLSGNGAQGSGNGVSGNGTDSSGSSADSLGNSADSSAGSAVSEDYVNLILSATPALSKKLNLMGMSFDQVKAQIASDWTESANPTAADLAAYGIDASAGKEMKFYTRNNNKDVIGVRDGTVEIYCAIVAKATAGSLSDVKPLALMAEDRINHAYIWKMANCYGLCRTKLHASPNPYVNWQSNPAELFVFAKNPRDCYYVTHYLGVEEP